MSNTVGKDIYMCCLERLIPGVIKLHTTLGNGNFEVKNCVDLKNMARFSSFNSSALCVVVHALASLCHNHTLIGKCSDMLL